LEVHFAVFFYELSDRLPHGIALLADLGYDAAVGAVLGIQTLHIAFCRPEWLKGHPMRFFGFVALLALLIAYWPLVRHFSRFYPLFCKLVHFVLTQPTNR
jgi:hypothetical protein